MAASKSASLMTPKRWKTVRKAVQYVALVAFVALFVASRRGGWAADLVNTPMRFDPLGMLAGAIASRALLAGSALALVVLVLTLVFGRAWCGWLCPLGTVLDYFTPQRKIQPIFKEPARLRSVKYVLLLTTLVAALFTNLTLLVFDPLMILFRTLTVAIWPAIDRIISAAETALYPVGILQDPINAFDKLVRPTLLPDAPMYYRDAALFAAFFIGLIALNWIAPRFWCRYLCPLGGLLGLLSKISLVRRVVVASECTGCDACARVCPTGTIQFGKNGASDPSECTMCLECLRACPRGGETFKPVLGLAKLQPYDPGRRQVLASIGVAAVGASILRSATAARRDDPHLVRPPGARENDLTSKCIRCGECMRACPTSALQPALFEAGLEGLWTPVLLPRLGYCDYSCNACGQVCPVQAIPPLSLDDKRLRVIGKAYIDTTRCIAWADHRDCIVCEEMCPLPEKAIKLDEAQVRNADGETVTVKLPMVNRERCIGCGICEYKCPIGGTAAIRVFTPTTDVPG
jgi:polyferredoxin